MGTEPLTAFERFKERAIGKIDAVKASCWFFHRWTRWRVLQRNNIVRVFADKREGVVGQCTLQQRECTRCGRVQIHTIRVDTV